MDYARMSDSDLAREVFLGHKQIEEFPNARRHTVAHLVSDLKKEAAKAEAKAKKKAAAKKKGKK